MHFSIKLVKQIRFDPLSVHLYMKISFPVFYYVHQKVLMFQNYITLMCLVWRYQLVVGFICVQSNPKLLTMSPVEWATYGVTNGAWLILHWGKHNTDWNVCTFCKCFFFFFASVDLKNIKKKYLKSRLVFELLLVLFVSLLFVQHNISSVSAKTYGVVTSYLHHGGCLR